MTVYQLLDALDYGDAVSNHCIELHKILSLNNINNGIYSKFSHNKVDTFRKPIEDLSVDENDIIIFHFSGKSTLIKSINNLKCKKVLIYHNITPEVYFEGMEPHYTHCVEGRKQLSKLVGMFDYYLGDSTYNLKELEEIGCFPCAVLPIVVELEVKNHKKLSLMKNTSGKKIIFVGRVAPNKKHEDLLEIFEYFFTYIDPRATLHLIGNYEAYPIYYNRLINICNNLISRNNIFFTGKVSEEELDYHYRTADAFLSMSEHEGFCVPLLESMSYGLPTFAFKAGAIDTTMGDAGIKLLDKEYEYIAELLDYTLGREELLESIVEDQYKWLEHFSVENTTACLLDIIERVKSL